MQVIIHDTGQNCKRENENGGKVALEMCRPLIARERGSTGSIGSIGSKGLMRRIKIRSAAEFR